MNRLATMQELIRYLDATITPPADEAVAWRTLRALFNTRAPQPVSAAFLELQDAFLQNEIAQKGIVDTRGWPRIALWQGDIVRLKAGAIVNAANSALLGCFLPNHACIDNAIHTYAGVQLRLECVEIMRKQGHPEPSGQAKLTRAYNLPADYVLHTVGPIIASGVPNASQVQQLADCYRHCLQLAQENGIRSVAFCGISTGEFRYPKAEAAEIAIRTVRDSLAQYADMRVIFNVFSAQDREIYARLLAAEQEEFLIE